MLNRPIRRKAIFLENSDDTSDYWVGRDRPELIYARRGDDFVFGRGGDDLIKAGLGNDIVAGGCGADRLLGEGGDDWISGGTGRDVMTGGSGADEFIFRARAGIDRITDFALGLDVVTFDLIGHSGTVAHIDKIRLGTSLANTVVEWSWDEQDYRIVFSGVTAGLTADDFRNFTFSDQALDYLV